jgi:hypothetical protein
MEFVVDLESVGVTVIDLVNGWVVGIPEIVLVKEPVRECVMELVILFVGDCDFVNG